MSMTKSFLKYYTHVNKIFGDYFLMFKIEYLVTWKNVMLHVHG
jgi:hypothetical protein